MMGHRGLQTAEDNIFNGSSSGIFNSTNPADQTIEETKSIPNDPLSLIVCIVILAPCIFSCFFQISYKIKKRRQDRVEREILEVTTNPTSRRMVLDEIFKGSSKLVEFPSNKRRVQVKKYRKKTAEERRLGRSTDEEEHELSSSAGGDDDRHFDEEMGSVQGRMIICISDKKKNSEEQATSSDDVSASSIDSCESGNYCDNNNKSKGPNLVEEEEEPSPATVVSTTVALADETSDDSPRRSPKRISPNSPREQLHAEEPLSILTKLSIPDVDEESTWNASALSPKLTPNPHDEFDDEKIGSIFRTFSNELPMAPTLCQEISASKTSSGFIIPVISDDEDDDDDDDASIEEEEEVFSRSSIFRSEVQGVVAKIEPSSSTLTEVTSNVVDPGVNNVDVVLSSSERCRKESIDLSLGSDADSRLLKNAVPLTNVDSVLTDASSKAETSSHFSYFSYEDETVASDQAEECAICICPYDVGDIRIFSKKCPHSFHKDCLFEWLVKNHHECPCCRSEMVSKSEVKETSASLVGTERLAQALASTMVEAPPLRFPQARIARQMIERARQRRRRSTQDETNDESSARQNTVNSHWIWNSRFEPTNLSSVNEAFPQPAGLSQSSTTTTRNQVIPPPPPLQARSFDAVMESQPAGVSVSRSFDAITDPQQTQVQDSSRSVASNPRNFHNHWANWNRSPRGRLRQSGSGNSPNPESLSVIVLPAI